MRWGARLFALTLLLAPAAVADELRMADGEVLHGVVEEAKGARLRVRIEGGTRQVRAADVSERIAADPPEMTIRAREALLDAEDADGRVELAAWAWSRRRDAAFRRLAMAALAIDADHARARSLLAFVRVGDAWHPGLEAPHGTAGEVGPRWGKAGRQASLKAGGTRSRKRADKALAWMAAHQDEDGRIDADGFPRHCPGGEACDGRGGGHHGERMPCVFDGVTTSLAVLSWSASGSTLRAGTYKDSLATAVSFCRSIVEQGIVGFDAIWNVTFAVEALADVCAASRDVGLRAVVARGVDLLEARQRPDGGYSYVYSVGDVPTTAAVLRALGQAAQAGIGVNAEGVRRALDFLDRRVHASSGRSEYHRGAERRGYTPTRANAAAALAGHGAVGRLARAASLGRQLAAAREQKPRWKLEMKEVKTRDGRVVTAQVGSLYPYLWYMADLALLEGGGSAAQSWRKSLRAALAAGQRADGHAAGSWDPLGTYSLSGGRAFVTGLGALMLLSIHRYPGAR